MPPERHVIQKPDDLCYKLSARLRHQSQAVELNGFRSIPEAQAGIAEFVLATAPLGEITDICLERRDTPDTASPGVAYQVVKRWSGELAARILRQHGLLQGQKTPGVSPAPTLVEMAAPVEAPLPPNPDRVTAAALPLHQSNGAAPANDRTQPPFARENERLDDQAASADPQPESAPCQHVNEANHTAEPIHQLADVVEPKTMSGTRLDALPPLEQKPLPKQRPPTGTRHTGYHRRTRWELAIAIVLTAAVAVVILLWDSGGDPMSLFVPHAATNMPRESLPFQVRPPASRGAGANAPSH